MRHDDAAEPGGHRATAQPLRSPGERLASRPCRGRARVRGRVPANDIAKVRESVGRDRSQGEPELDPLSVDHMEHRRHRLTGGNG